MLWHPRFRALCDFADGTLPSGRVSGIARHLSECERCRRAVWSIRAIDGAAQEVRVPPLPDDLLDQIMARRASGADIILPTVAAELTPTAALRWRPHITAAGVIALVAVGVLWPSPPRLEAEGSELRFEPARPRAGEQIRVTYHASSLLADQPMLALRARYRTPSSSQGDQQIVTRLLPSGDRLFSGSFVLPDSVVYAIFAVEDTAATVVDHKANSGS